MPRTGPGGGGRRREAALRGPEGGPGAGPGPVPVTVLTGFLGSGKTTVLGHLLRSGAAGGKRLGVVSTRPYSPVPARSARSAREAPKKLGTSELPMGTVVLVSRS